MASRDIKDCTLLLQSAWLMASSEFQKKYPTLPQPFLTCTYRSPEEQTKLYNQPWDKIDNDKDNKIDEPDERVTGAKAMQSFHNFKPARAFDIAFKYPGKPADWTPSLFNKFSQIIRKIDPQIKWGGTFRKADYCHFELDKS